MCNVTSFHPEGILTRRFLAVNVDSSGAAVSSSGVGSAVGTVKGSGADSEVVPTSYFSGDAFRSGAGCSAYNAFGNDKGKASTQESIHLQCLPQTHP